MDSIGNLLANAADLPKTRPTLPPERPRFSVLGEPQLFKVKMSVLIVAEIEVMAPSPEHAFRAAEARATEAKRLYRTAPMGFAPFIRKLVDRRDKEKGYKWVELVQTRGEDGNLHWVDGKDEAV